MLRRIPCAGTAVSIPHAAVGDLAFADRALSSGGGGGGQRGLAAAAAVVAAQHPGHALVGREARRGAVLQRHPVVQLCASQHVNQMDC